MGRIQDAALADTQTHDGNGKCFNCIWKVGIIPNGFNAEPLVCGLDPDPIQLRRRRSAAQQPTNEGATGGVLCNNPELGPISPADDSCRDAEGLAWYAVDNRRFLICFTDGSAADNDDPRFRRAGYGVYFGKNHAWNQAGALGELHSDEYTAYTGWEQGNNAAELRAVVEALRTLRRHGRTCAAEIRSDSKYVCDGLAKLDNWRSHQWRRRHGARTRLDNWETWRALYELRELFGRGNLRIVWVKAHVTTEMLAAGRVTAFNLAGNAGADAQAAIGAALHTVPRDDLRAAAMRIQLGIAIQRYMLEVSTTRHEQLLDLQAAEQRDKGDAPLPTTSDYPDAQWCPADTPTQRLDPGWTITDRIEAADERFSVEVVRDDAHLPDTVEGLAVAVVRLRVRQRRVLDPSH
eukprot:gene12788-biopygen27303